MSSARTLIDIPTVAERLGVDTRFVRRLVHENRLPYIKVGKFVRFEQADVEAWIADRRVEPKGRGAA